MVCGEYEYVLHHGRTLAWERRVNKRSECMRIGACVRSRIDSWQKQTESDSAWALIPRAGLVGVRLANVSSEPKPRPRSLSAMRARPAAARGARVRKHDYSFF